jgi:hypothetical protein
MILLLLKVIYFFLLGLSYAVMRDFLQEDSTKEIKKSTHPIMFYLIIFVSLILSPFYIIMVYAKIVFRLTRGKIKRCVK